MFEIYVSTDVETDGPIPGPHSMLSLGSAAWRVLAGRKELVSTFEANLETLPGAEGHPDTIRWWTSQPEAWKICRTDPKPPEEVMKRFSSWLRELPGVPVFVAWPLGFDFTFVYWYLMRFTGRSPFQHHGIDIRSYAMAMLGGGYKDHIKECLPRRWFDEGLPHTHRSLDDAIEQGALFCNMLMENQGAKRQVV
jgi:hypothetical protein